MTADTGSIKGERFAKTFLITEAALAHMAPGIDWRGVEERRFQSEVEAKGYRLTRPASINFWWDLWTDEEKTRMPDHCARVRRYRMEGFFRPLLEQPR